MNFYLRHFCQPQTYRSLEEREAVFRSNQGILISEICFALAYLLVTPFLHAKPLAHAAFFAIILSSLLSFLSLARKNILLYKCIYTGLRLLFPLLCFLDQSMFMFSLLSLSFLPSMVLMRTDNTKLALITSAINVSYLNYIFPSLLEHQLNSLSTAAFTDSFIKWSTTFMLINMIVLYSLNHKISQSRQYFSKAKKQADDTIQQLQNFILTIAHELRNPLNALLGNLDLAAQEAKNIKIASAVETSKICSEVLLQLTNNILDSGKLEAGGLEVQPSETNVASLFRRIWLISNELIKRKGLIGKIYLDKKIPTSLQLDPTRITQIVLNLVGNALKFTTKGQISVTLKWVKGNKVGEECFKPTPYDVDEEPLFEKDVNTLILENCSPTSSKNSLKFQPSEAGILKIIIRDTGCGMSKDSLLKIFQKFAQVSDDPSHKRMGTGLGLYITREIIKKMNGEIRAYSVPNYGSTFIACIPTLPAGKPALSRTSSESPLENLVDKKLKALMGSDSQLTSYLMSQYLLKMQAEVLIASKSLDGLFQNFISNCMSGKDTELLILDFEVNSASILEMVRKIREYELLTNRERCGIVIVSCDLYDKHYLRDKMDRTVILKKPLKYEEFINTVNTFF